METPKERIIRDRERQDYIESIPLREDYEKTFGTPEGQRVLLDFIVKGRVFSRRFQNSGWTAFNEGSCDFVLDVGDFAPKAFKAAVCMFFDELMADQAKWKAELLNQKE